MTHEFDNSGNLVLIPSINEIDMLKDNRQSEGFNSDDFMMEVMESFICNTGFRFVRPEEIGALTDAPILGECDENGEYDTVYAFMDYQVRSIQQDLLEYGRAVFIKY